MKKLLQFSPENIILDKESADYAAATFTLNNQPILFRMAKKTPTKIGQFITIWKRINDGPIQPFDASDPFDFLIVQVQSSDHMNTGQFIFSKKILCEQNIFSQNNIGGKRAMRVYAPWDMTDNKQAKSTQKWQVNYFVEGDNLIWS